MVSPCRRRRRPLDLEADLVALEVDVQEHRCALYLDCVVVVVVIGPADHAQGGVLQGEGNQEREG